MGKPPAHPFRQHAHGVWGKLKRQSMRDKHRAWVTQGLKHLKAPAATRKVYYETFSFSAVVWPCCVEGLGFPMSALR